MGGVCEGKNDDQEYENKNMSFEVDERHDEGEKKLYRNLEVYPDDGPVREFAIVARKKPRLNAMMEKIRNQELSASPLEKPSWRGVPLPCYMLKDINVYYEG